MPKRTDIQSILIIGAGPIIIGQACEFDYSGTQACKALKKEGYRVILVNSNPATIMTDPDIADSIYIEPINWRTVEAIIQKEKPNALLPTMGGQTALNTALDLASKGILELHNVELIGATKEAIDKAEDRDLFKKAMQEINIDVARSGLANNLDEAIDLANTISYPIIIRPSFTMGGSGGGVATNEKELIEITTRGLDLSPTNEILIEESLIGWKEFEMEVVRDKSDNTIIICSIENLDPMGVHTGDSITVAPAQTLTDKEYQIMRDCSLKVLRKIGVDTGGSNVQFAINPENGRMIIIEMNPRVSRSSALASKATGFPIAKIAAKLAVGFTLDELKNDITGGRSPASFEPSIDYVVTKIPKFTFEKFPNANPTLTTQMKSVGEVMAIGRNFQESLQKALRGLENGHYGFTEINNTNNIEELITTPSAERILYLGQAFREGLSLDKIQYLTKIDPWFLSYIEEIISLEQTVKELSLETLDKDLLFQLKRKGFSDIRLAELISVSELDIYNYRKELKIKPVFKRVDTCAAEFETSTAYLYSTYEEECESLPTNNKKILILGGGPNRIGQGIEFDYCCVHAAFAVSDSGYESIMVNCNPETVSTDYDTSDRLYFEPLTFEDVMAIVNIEQPEGIIVQFGGQTPLKLAKQLQEAGAPIIGTSPESIDIAEDRERFKKIVTELDLLQPYNEVARTKEEAIKNAAKVEYPLVVRPSYVLGGRAMDIVYNDNELNKYMEEAVKVSNDSPVLLDHFLDKAIEVDIDAVSDGENILIGGIMEHIEQAGVHSGDSACSIPPITLSLEIQDQLIKQMIAFTKKLNVIGLVNAQFAVRKNKIFILEVNPRASRTVPFVSKATGNQLAKIAAKAMIGVSLNEQNEMFSHTPGFFSVKSPVFPFNKFPDTDPILGPEMKSTGEVMGTGKTFSEAYIKSQYASGTEFSLSGSVFISVREPDKTQQLINISQKLINQQYKLIATKGTYEFLVKNNIDCSCINKVHEGKPHIVEKIKNKEIDLIINTTEGKQSIKESFSIRAEAVIKNVTYYTSLEAAIATIDSLDYFNNIDINKIQNYKYNKVIKNG
ncbi:MAG: carbamoyl-phosphate synthase large subunit [Gammaproteobacteria bacterium]|nr:carbamoyl-phosphate synthase large subunit [Gammaproteobacteria bacterium]